jgi:type I restriction enzyme S subunit
VVPAIKPMSLHFLYHALVAQDLARLGSDSAVPGLNRNQAYMSKLVVPNSSVLTAFDDKVAPFFCSIHAHELESRTLDTLRETILSKLMNGELSPKQSAKEIEHA